MYKVYADGQLLFATGNPNFANTAILEPTLTTEINTRRGSIHRVSQQEDRRAEDLQRTGF